MSTTTEATKTINLIMVTEGNNNKYYDMFDHGDGTMHVEYGRVEATKTSKNYPISKWDSLYKAKTKKGYKDVTKFKSVLQEGAETNSKDLFNITNPEVKRIIKLLDSYSKKSVQQNYSVSSQAVTKEMVDEAQSQIDALLIKANKGTSKEEFNKALIELFHVIPRKMQRVNDYLIDFDIKTDKDVEEAQKFVAKEQDVLDPLRTQVDMNATVKQEEEGEAEQIDILKVMGIEMSPVVDDETISMIKDMMGPEKNLFKSAFKVKNYKTQAKYDKHLQNAKDKKTELFWHGSINQNWSSILSSGLMIRPTGAVHTGSMFGDGIYAADKFRKSLGYTSFRGSYWAGGGDRKAFLALFSFHVGKQLHIKHHNSSCYSLSSSVLKNKGDYDSVFAHGGADLRNNEYIVYDSNQVTVEYIVEIEQ